MKSKNRFVKYFKERNIETKITLVFAIVFCSIFFLVSILVIMNTSYFYKKNAKKELDKAVEQVIQYLENGGDYKKENIDQIIDNKNIQIFIFKEYSQNLNESNDFLEHKSINNYTLQEEGEQGPFIPPNLRKRKPSDFNFTEHDGVRYLYTEKEVEINDEIFKIQGFRTNFQEDNIIKSFYYIFIVANILGIIIVYFIIRFTSKKFLLIIRNITKTAENISINDLSKRITVPKNNDELTHLIITINDMLSRVESVMNSQNQFISDASHELRTPIAVIKGYADLISRWGKNDITILEESIDSIKNEIDHMSNLIEKLMFLAKGNENYIRKDILFLNEMLEDICKDIKIVKDNLEISLEMEPDLYILGDENLIKQMIWIFLDNSIKYCDKKQIKIAINLNKKDKYIFINIEDNGKGIKEEDISFIFDRFYRGDKSRSKEVVGNGLGLSIAKLVANKHNASITVESVLNQGSLFIIKLPSLELNMEG